MKLSQRFCVLPALVLCLGLAMVLFPGCKAGKGPTPDQIDQFADVAGSAIDAIRKFLLELYGKGKIGDAAIVAADTQLREQYPAAYAKEAQAASASSTAWSQAVTAARSRISTRS